MQVVKIQGMSTTSNGYFLLAGSKVKLESDDVACLLTFALQLIPPGQLWASFEQRLHNLALSSSFLFLQLALYASSLIPPCNGVFLAL